MSIPSRYSLVQIQQWKHQNNVLNLFTEEMYSLILASTAQKMKFFVKYFFSKCEQICSFLQIC